ncbi:MAG: dTDP-4-dehydrorhamnose reductase [Candidatus Omnitrophota bacterium]
MGTIKKILVTGASGHLGNELIPILSKSFTVVGVSRNRSISNRPAKVEELKLDLSQKASIEKIVSLKPEIIIHSAALSDVDFCQTHPEEAIRHNVKATEHIVESAKELDACLIHISSDHVFDGNKDSSYTELDATRPINIYGTTKLEAEAIVKNRLKKFIILRVSWIFGDVRRGFVNFVLESAKKSEVIKIVSDKKSSPTYTFDLSIAIEFLINSAQFDGEVYHFTNSGQGCSWFEYAKEILNLSGLKAVKLEPITLKELNLPAPRPKNSILDNLKFLKFYKRPIRTWAEALWECITRRR